MLLCEQRVTTDTTPSQVALEQLQHVLPLLPQDTVSVLDRGYDSTWFWCQCSALGHKGTLIRLKSNRCLYRAAPERTNRRGAPRKDGNKLRPDAAATHANPDGQWEGTDDQQRPVQLTWWNHLHVKDARSLDLSVIRVVRPHASNSERDPRISWFVWIGDPDADLVRIGLGYVLRFSHEHGYRFQKQSLLWDQPRLRTPEQVERWTHLVAIAHTHLVLARELVQPVLRPWESRHRPATPQQVMSTFLPSLGTPARHPHPRGKSPGRAKGVKIGKAKRFSVVKEICRSRVRSVRRVAQKLHRLFVRAEAGKKQQEQLAEQQRTLYQQLISSTEQMVRQAKQVSTSLLQQTEKSAQSLAEKVEPLLPLIEHVIVQARARVLEGKQVAASDKVLSLFEPQTRLIPRHKGSARCHIL